jgi:hypothetical protein
MPWTDSSYLYYCFRMNKGLSAMSTRFREPVVFRLIYIKTSLGVPITGLCKRYQMTPYS